MTDTNIDIADFLDGLDKVVDEVFANASELLDPHFLDDLGCIIKHPVAAGDSVKMFREVITKYEEAHKEYLKSLKLYRLVTRDNNGKRHKYDFVFDTLKLTFKEARNRIQQQLDQNPDDVIALREKEELFALWSGVMLLVQSVDSVISIPYYV
jgi:hypothetical protein